MGLENQATKLPEVTPAAGTDAPLATGSELIDGFSAELAAQMADAVAKTIKTPGLTPRVGEPQGGLLDIPPAPELQPRGDNSGKDNTNRVPEENEGEEVKDKTLGGQIMSAAELAVGERKWQEAKYAAATHDGKLGASAAVSAVLRDAGVEVDEISVNGLEQALLQKGWQKVPFDQRQAGDVVIARRENSYGNSGIVGEGNSIFTNSYRSGVWKQETTAPWIVDGHNRYSQVYVLRSGDQSK